MLKEICKEIDLVIANQEITENFLKLISKVIDEEPYSDNSWVSMVYDIHNEIDQLVAGSKIDPVTKKLIIPTPPDWMIDFFKDVKIKNQGFWKE